MPNPNELDALAKAVEEVLADLYGQKLGFALFMFPWDGEGEAGDYVSNSERSTMIKFMREIADRIEAREEVGRPIGTA
jgi:hypothetical protein